jgi:hypothetical protein
MAKPDASSQTSRPLVVSLVPHLIAAAIDAVAQGVAGSVYLLELLLHLSHKLVTDVGARRQWRRWRFRVPANPLDRGRRSAVFPD